jgi:hypothetical protein
LDCPLEPGNKDQVILAIWRGLGIQIPIFEVKPCIWALILLKAEIVVICQFLLKILVSCINSRVKSPYTVCTGKGALGVMYGTKCAIAVVTCDSVRKVRKGGAKCPKNC